MPATANQGISPTALALVTTHSPTRNPASRTFQVRRGSARATTVASAAPVPRVSTSASLVTAPKSSPLTVMSSAGATSQATG